jgi:prephenate dehydrogenase
VIERLLVVGVGLIGGSFALAMRRAGRVRRIEGLGRTRASLDEACKLGVIDAGHLDFAAAAGADLVLLSVPVGSTAEVLRRLAPHLDVRTVITDAGSTKCDVIAAARAALAEKFAQFVPAHPIAGAEKSGVGAAHAELFRGCKTVLTPLAETSAEAAALVAEAWQACGAELRSMSPEEHDRVFAAVSHLPHLLAFALVHDVASQPNAATLFEYAASGFRDFTRIASSSPAMWRDICIANREHLGEQLTRYRAVLDLLQNQVDSGDAAALEAVFRDAREAREQWLARKS